MAGLCSPMVLRADSTPTPVPPVVVPHDGKLAGVPDNIKTLIVNFDQVRDKYLAQQKALLTQLKAATTPAERDQIRQQLQDNRQAFLDALKTFRDQLKDDLTALKGKISHEEFQRILDVAHKVATEGGPQHHRGH